MNAKLHLKQLRRKAYLGYHQDGIIDLLIGATIIGFGFWRMTDNIVFTSLSWLSFSLYVGLKRMVTIPRFGYVRFDEVQRKTQISIGLGLLIILMLAIGGLLFFARPDQLSPEMLTFMRKFHEFVMSGIGAATMILFGLLFGITRIVGYGIFMLISLWFAIQIGFPGDLTLLTIGGLILIVGFILLANFIRRYPVQSTESENGA
jgi:hypothetical protein